MRQGDLITKSPCSIALVSPPVLSKKERATSQCPRVSSALNIRRIL